MKHILQSVTIAALAGCTSQANPQSQTPQTMFTLDQITAVHSKVKSGADFPAYVQDMKALGVVRYENHLSDGHATYYGADGFVLQGPARYAAISVADTAAADDLKQAIATHQQGGTDFLTVSRQAAEAGVEKWEVHILELTCTYLDKAGNVMMVEEIPVPEMVAN
jgi:uncharacterized protein YbcV (DUF1398 family)